MKKSTDREEKTLWTANVKSQDHVISQNVMVRKCRTNLIKVLLDDVMLWSRIDMMLVWEVAPFGLMLWYDHMILNMLIWEYDNLVNNEMRINMMIFYFFKHIFCSGGGSVASLGGVRDLPLARSHHLQLLCQLLHLYLQGGISLIYFHLYFTCLKTFNIYLSTDKRGFKK